MARAGFRGIDDPAEREATAADFMVRLAALHALRPEQLNLPGFGAPITIAEAVNRELDVFDALLAQRGGEADPALTFTLDWLRAHVPDDDQPAVLVQGDTGPGNFMFGDGKVVAIVDWELAHLGDPLEDIAWLSLRSTQEPFTDFPTRLVEYEFHSGHHIDRKRVHYYQVMAEAKLQVMSHRPAGSASGEERAEPGGGDVGNAFIYGILHRRLWLEALAEVVDLSLTAAEIAPDPERREHQWMYDAVLEQLREVVVPGIDDPLIKVRTKGIARMIKYLAQLDAYGAFFDECELGDLEKLLKHRPTSITTGRSAVASAVRGQGIEERGICRVPLAQGGAAETSWPDPPWVRWRIVTGHRFSEPVTVRGVDGVDLAALKAQRVYPTFTAKDDDFHDEDLGDGWWKTETSWFSWNVPDRKMGGWLYSQARPNARICNGGAWVWDDSAAPVGTCPITPITTASSFRNDRHAIYEISSGQTGCGPLCSNR